MEQFGRYELRRRLGVGGMAEVYEALAFGEHGVEKPLVIKRILEEHGSDPEFRAMFIDEARIAMRLNHPNVVQVFEFGKADDRYFLAMELVRGRDLSALIARARQLDRTVPAGVAVFIAGEVAKGLDHAHRLAGSDGKRVGLVHRDVSPQNVLLSTDGAVKIGDFGIANFDSRKGRTQVATVRGKVRYMSPEQADSEPLDARSDLFSLGVVLYEMVTGTFAFDGRTDLDVLDDVRRADPRRPSEITAVPPELERILAKVLARDRDARYPRGNDLQHDLEIFASTQGLRASSSALAEFLLSLFPELERVSDEREDTRILDIAEASPEALQEEQRREGSREESTAAGLRRESTQIRRIFEKDGLPVFVSEEVPAVPSGSDHDDHTVAPSVDPEATYVPVEESTSSAMEFPVGSVFPEGASHGPARARRAETVVRRPETGSPEPPPAVERETEAVVRPAAPPEVPPPDVLERRSRASMHRPAMPAPPAPAAVAVEPVAKPFRRREAPDASRPPLTAAFVVLGLVAVWALWTWIPLDRLSMAGGAGDSSGVETNLGSVALKGNSGDQVVVNDKTYVLPLNGKLDMELPPGLHDVEVTGNDGYYTVFSVNVVRGETLAKTLRQKGP